jgi:hypothetical protein
MIVISALIKELPNRLIGVSRAFMIHDQDRHEVSSNCDFPYFRLTQPPFLVRLLSVSLMVFQCLRAVEGIIWNRVRKFLTGSLGCVPSFPSQCSLFPKLPLGKPTTHRNGPLTTRAKIIPHHINRPSIEPGLTYPTYNTPS